MFLFYLGCWTGCQWQSFHSTPQRGRLVGHWCHCPRSHTERERETQRHMLSVYNIFNANSETRRDTVSFALWSDMARSLVTANRAQINPRSPKPACYINTCREITHGLQLDEHGTMESATEKKERRGENGGEDEEEEKTSRTRADIRKDLIHLHTS